MIEILRISGEAVRPYLSQLAKLRTEIFREFPYLYDGQESYEQEYLQSYTQSERSVVVLALKNSEVVGVSTGLPLADAGEAFQKPFVDAGLDCSRIFYFGESVLRKSERGHGIGHRFFDEREGHAREHGFSTCTFCSVIRPDDHPEKPHDYRSHDEFWHKRGYQKHESMTAELEWKQIDQQAEVRNRLVFWIKDEI